MNVLLSIVMLLSVIGWLFLGVVISEKEWSYTQLTSWILFFILIWVIALKCTGVLR